MEDAAHRATILICGSFDPFLFQQDGLFAAEVDVGGHEIFQALVMMAVIVGDR